MRDGWLDPVVKTPYPRRGGGATRSDQRPSELVGEQWSGMFEPSGARMPSPASGPEGSDAIAGIDPDLLSPNDPGLEDCEPKVLPPGLDAGWNGLFGQRYPLDERGRVLDCQGDGEITGTYRSSFDWRDDWEMYQGDKTAQNEDIARTLRTCFPEQKVGKCKICAWTRSVPLADDPRMSTLNLPAVAGFPAVCDELDLPPGGRRERRFVDWVRQAWLTLYESLDLVFVVMECLHPEFRKSDHKTRRELLYRIVRGVENDQHPRSVHTRSGCLTVRDLFVAPRCDSCNSQAVKRDLANGIPASGKSWCDDGPPQDTEWRHAVHVWMSGRTLDVFQAYLDGVNGHDSAMSGAAVVWLAGVLFHELLHVADFPFNQPPPEGGCPKQKHEPGHDVESVPRQPCDWMYWAHHAFNQQLVRRYPQVLSDNVGGLGLGRLSPEFMFGDRPPDSWRKWPAATFGCLPGEDT